MDLYALDETLEFLNTGKISYISEDILMETYNEAILFNDLITESVKDNVKSLWERFKAWLEKFKQNCIAAYNQAASFISRKVGSGFINAAKINRSIAEKLVKKADDKNVTICSGNNIDTDETIKNIKALKDVIEDCKNAIKSVFRKSNIYTMKTDQDIVDFIHYKDEINDLADDIENNVADKFKKSISDLSSTDIVVRIGNVLTLKDVPDALDQTIETAKSYNDISKELASCSRDVSYLVSTAESRISSLITTFAMMQNKSKDEDSKVSLTQLNTCITSYITSVNNIYAKYNKLAAVLTKSILTSIIGLTSEVTEIKTKLSKLDKEESKNEEAKASTPLLDKKD